MKALCLTTAYPFIGLHVYDKQFAFFIVPMIC